MVVLVAVVVVAACAALAVTGLPTWRAVQARRTGLAVPGGPSETEPSRVLAVTVAFPVGADTLRSAIADGMEILATSTPHRWPWRRRARQRVAVFAAPSAAHALGGHGSVLTGLGHRPNEAQLSPDRRAAWGWPASGWRRSSDEVDGVDGPQAVVLSAGRAIAPDQVWLVEVDADWQPPVRTASGDTQPADHEPGSAALLARRRLPGALERQGHQPAADVVELNLVDSAGSADSPTAAPLPPPRTDPALEARKAQDAARRSAHAELSGELARLTARAESLLAPPAVADRAAGLIELPAGPGHAAAIRRPSVEIALRDGREEGAPAAVQGVSPNAGLALAQLNRHRRRMPPPSAVWIYQIDGPRSAGRPSHMRLLGGLPAAGGVVGRSARAAVQIPAEAVSERHFRVEPTPQGWTIHDLGSRNGTYVNGERVEQASPLENGDDIRLGRSVLLRFIVGDRYPTSSAGQPHGVGGRSS